MEKNGKEKRIIINVHPKLEMRKERNREKMINMMLCDEKGRERNREKKRRK